jgi:hypothetical protein
MTTFTFVMLVSLGVLLGVLFRAIRVWLRLRGRRLITCPENQRPAGVTINAGRAAARLAFTPEVRLSECSRWPEHRNCGQECLQQIALSPNGCLVRKILGDWYTGRQCAVCGKPFHEINWADHKPGLLSPQGQTVEWSKVPAESVPGVLATHSPVCWNCHIMQSFCKQHPELVVDRSRPA